METVALRLPEENLFQNLDCVSQSLTPGPTGDPEREHRRRDFMTSSRALLNKGSGDESR